MNLSGQRLEDIPVPRESTPVKVPKDPFKKNGKNGKDGSKGEKACRFLFQK
jgi:hypothetical protein